MNEKIQQITAEIDEAVGRILMQHFNATSGDVDPLVTIRFQNATEALVRDWIANNVTARRDYERHGSRRPTGEPLLTEAIMARTYRATYICRICGDRRLPPPHDWAGEGDRLPGESEPQYGGLGGCGDLHDWVPVEAGGLASAARSGE